MAFDNHTVAFIAYAGLGVFHVISAICSMPVERNAEITQKIPGSACVGMKLSHIVTCPCRLEEELDSSCPSPGERLVHS